MKTICVAAYSVLLAAAEGPQELNNRALQLYRQARYQEAEAVYRAALNGWAQTPGSERDQAITLNNLAVLYRTLGRYPEAENALLDSLRTLESSEGPGSARAGQALINLAEL